MSGGSHRTSAYYSASVDRFLATDAHLVLGALAAAHTHDLEVDQRQAWEQEIDNLTAALPGLTGTLHLEFEVPRLGSRIDAVLVSGPAIFPIEFKCGERQFHLADYNQAWDYALDLKNFHAASHDAPIFPILVATQSVAIKSFRHKGLEQFFATGNKRRIQANHEERLRLILATLNAATARAT